MVLESSPMRTFRIGVLSNLEPSLSETKLGHAVRNYLISCRADGKSPATIKSYSQVLKALLVFYRDMSLKPEPKRIEASDIRLFFLSLQERGDSQATINRYYRCLGTFFRWLIAEGVADKNPLANIKPPRPEKKIVQPFSRGDIDSLLLQTSGSKFLDLRNRAIVLLFLDTGLRLSELANIQLDDMDFDEETIRVTGKGAKQRVVRMGRQTQKALLRYLLARDDGYPCLWVTEERRPLTKWGIKNMVRTICRRAGVTDARPSAHTFRHTAAISLLRNGAGEFTLQIMLGHSTLQMTRRYVAALGQEDMIRAHRKFSPVDRLGIS